MINMRSESRLDNDSGSDRRRRDGAGARSYCPYGVCARSCCRSARPTSRWRNSA